jgi:hypothetical protein
MNSSRRHHLTQLDRTIVQLFNERARLLCASTELEETVTAHVDDLLQRSTGPFPAEALRQAFEAIDRGCQEAGQ